MATVHTEEAAYDGVTRRTNGKAQGAVSYKLDPRSQEHNGIPAQNAAVSFI